MKWWDFNDLSFRYFAIIVGAFFLFLVFLIVTFAILNAKAIKYQAQIKSESNSIRVYQIDVKRNLVTYFNRSDLRHKRSVDLNRFYAHFHPNDVDKLKDWIFQICTNGKKAEKYLEVDVVTRRNKSFFSLLKLLKYSDDVGVIHIESHLMKYITPTNVVKKKRRGIPTGVVKRSDIAQLISKNRALRGYTFAIRFFYVRQKVFSNDKIERYMVMTLKNVIYPYANSIKEARQILESNESEILLFDLHIANDDDAMHLASCIEHDLKKCIGVNGYSSSINFAIGIVQNYQYYQDFDTIVSKAQETCVNARTNNQRILLYQKSASRLLDANKYNEQVENLLKPGQLRYLFRPIIDVEHKTTIGYFQYVKGYDTPFTSYQEMSKYSAKMGKNRDLFAVVSKYVVSKFVGENYDPAAKLFFSVSLSDLDHILDILPQTPNVNQVSLVLILEEQEVNENANQLELIDAAIKKFKEFGFETALIMKDKNLLLNSEFYQQFDFFIAGSAMVSEIRKNNRIRLSIHTLIESLLKYNKPIIATDLDGWQAIELVIKSGISLISSETISSSNDMLIPVEKKKLEKLESTLSKVH